MPSIEAMLTRAWRRRGAMAWLLLPLALVYSAVTTIRRALYRAGWLRSESVDVPVLVVGNVVAGGAGKTPVVIELIGQLQARGIAAGVISRGYGRESSRALPDVREVFEDSNAREAGDEPLLIKRATAVPVFVGRDRVGAARALLARHPDVSLILCDEGLQHYALQRDAEICVVGSGGAGNGWPLPAGPLRESGRSVTWVLDGRADTGRNKGDHPGVRATHGHFALRRRLADHAWRADGGRVSLASLAGNPLWAVCAIAHPQAFFDMLRERGLALDGCDALPDHYDFDSYKRPEDQCVKLICTEKDAVKLWRAHPEALAVPLELSIDPAFFAAWDVWLDSHVTRASAAPL